MAKSLGLPRCQTPPAPAELWGSELPDRPPNLCPGCPHRATYYSVKMALKDLGREGFFPPTSAATPWGSCRPVHGGLPDLHGFVHQHRGRGISRTTGQTVVAFIGDSTFFHAGLTGPANAVHNGHDFLLVILDNGTTAMTGHQPHPGSPWPSGYPASPSISRDRAGLGVEQVWKVNPLKYQESLAATKEASI